LQEHDTVSHGAVPQERGGVVEHDEIDQRGLDDTSQVASDAANRPAPICTSGVCVEQHADVDVAVGPGTSACAAAEEQRESNLRNILERRPQALGQRTGVLIDHGPTVAHTHPERNPGLRYGPSCPHSGPRNGGDGGLPQG
jgi:hypothetical protein